MCHFSSYQWGGVPAILNIICMFIRHESKAQSLSPHYNKKVGKHFSIPSALSPFAPLSSPRWRVCPHLCWDNLLENPDFPSLTDMLKGNKWLDYCGQIHSKLELSLFGIPTNRAHPKRDSVKSNNRLNNYYLKGHEAYRDRNHFDHQCHFFHFLGASNHDRQVYDMHVVQDDKKIWVSKKPMRFEKSEFLKMF